MNVKRSVDFVEDVAVFVRVQTHNEDFGHGQVVIFFQHPLVLPQPVHRLKSNRPRIPTRPIQDDAFAPGGRGGVSVHDHGGVVIVVVGRFRLQVPFQSHTVDSVLLIPWISDSPLCAADLPTGLHHFLVELEKESPLLAGLASLVIRSQIRGEPVVQERVRQGQGRVGQVLGGVRQVRRLVRQNLLVVQEVLDVPVQLNAKFVDPTWTRMKGSLNMKTKSWKGSLVQKKWETIFVLAENMSTCGAKILRIPPSKKWILSHWRISLTQPWMILVSVLQSTWSVTAWWYSFRPESTWRRAIPVISVRSLILGMWVLLREVLYDMPDLALLLRGDFLHFGFQVFAPRTQAVSLESLFHHVRTAWTKVRRH